MICFHHWRLIKKDSDPYVRLVRCLKCNKVALHNIKKKYIFTRFITDFHMWCPKCDFDMSMIEWVSVKGLDYKIRGTCNECGHTSTWVTYGPLVETEKE